MPFEIPDGRQSDKQEICEQMRYGRLIANAEIYMRETWVGYVKAGYGNSKLKEQNEKAHEIIRRGNIRWRSGAHIRKTGARGRYRIEDIRTNTETIPRLGGNRMYGRERKKERKELIKEEERTQGNNGQVRQRIECG